MMKVYDMVTYGVCEPDDGVSTLHLEVPHTDELAGIPPSASRSDLQLGLQPVSFSVSQPRRFFPGMPGPALERFLNTLGD
ncbi:MAG: hypothetical protein WCZ87_11170 [Thiohalobacteraceae bacterium]